MFIVGTKVRWKTANGYATGIITVLLEDGNALVTMSNGKMMLLTPSNNITEVKDE